MFPSWFWVAGSLVLLCAVPFLVPIALPLRIAISVAVLVTVAFAWWRTSSRELSYFHGLDLIAKSFLSFDDNLTAIYLPTVLMAMHAAACAFGVMSLGRGRLASEIRWYDLVESFHRRRTKQPLSAVVPRPEGRAPSLLELLQGHGDAVLGSVDVPPSLQPWHRRYLLLYIPRSGTLIYHVGFFLGLFGVAGIASLYFSDPPRMSLHDAAAGGGLSVFIAIASYIAVRRKDAIHRVN